MATQTKKTDQKIINSGAMQYVMPFPAKGREWLVTREGAGLAISRADDLGKPNDATPFSLALRSLQVLPAGPSATFVTILSGPLPYEMPVPAEGRLIRVTVEGELLVVSVADDLGSPRDADPFTHAFRSLHVEPILADTHPFAPYRSPGLFYADPIPRAVDPEDNGVQHAVVD